MGGDARVIYFFLFFLARALFLILVVMPILMPSMRATGMLAMMAQMMVWVQKGDTLTSCPMDARPALA